MALHKDVKIGQVWTCRISGRIVQVKVTHEIEGTSKDRFRPYSRTTRGRWQVTNLTTNRITKVTAAKLRRLVREPDGSFSAAEVLRRLSLIEGAAAKAEVEACEPHGEEGCNLCPNEGTPDGPTEDLHEDEHADDDEAHVGYEDDSYSDCNDDND